MPKRQEAHVFDLPVQELRRGYLSDIYFWREKIALEKHNLHPEVTMQVFQKKNAVLCGVDEAVAVLKLAAGKYTDYSQAYKLFDKLIELKRRARQQFLAVTTMLICRPSNKEWKSLSNWTTCGKAVSSN